jgi:hypothetical protein
MGHRAPTSGIKLTERDAAMVKAMLARGDRQHDVAAWFGVNGGRIAEIATGRSFRSVAVADQAHLPPRGPYPSGRDAAIALCALVEAQQALANAEEVVRRFAHC